MNYEVTYLENNEFAVLSIEEIYARRCSVTLKGINCGYKTLDGIYFSEKINYKLLKHINEVFKSKYKNLTEALNEHKYIFEDWDWYEEWISGKELFYTKNGSEIKILRTLD